MTKPRPLRKQLAILLAALLIIVPPCVAVITLTLHLVITPYGWELFKSFCVIALSLVGYLFLCYQLDKYGHSDEETK